MLAIVLALGSGVAYGISDFLGGAKSRALSTLSVLLVSQCASLALLAVVVVVHGQGLPGGGFLLAAALAGVSEAVGIAALYRGLAGGTMSIVAPVAATAPVVPVTVGIALGEAPAPLQLVGVLLAVAGIVLTSIPGTAEATTAQRKRTPGAGRASAGFGVLAALGFGGFYVAMDAASEADVPWALFGARTTAVAIFAAAAVASRSRPALSVPDLPVLALIGALIVSADGMYALASTKGSSASSRCWPRCTHSSRWAWRASTSTSAFAVPNRSASRCASRAWSRSPREPLPTPATGAARPGHRRAAVPLWLGG